MRESYSRDARHLHAPAPGGDAIGEHILDVPVTYVVETAGAENDMRSAEPYSLRLELSEPPAE